jgi:hypothetical protein
VTRGGRSVDPFVASIRLVLEAAKRGRFRVALIGGFALPFFGVQRATGDVDFLADAAGAAPLHDALIEAGAKCLHRGPDAANYAAVPGIVSPVDFIFAARRRARAMLDRSRIRLLKGARIRVPVVDAEALIGLKLQALANNPRRRQDAADIAALFASRTDSLDVELLRDYYKLFDREQELEEALERRPRR